MRDALARAQRWHGPLEKRAAIWALLIDRDDREAWQRWETLVAHRPTAQRIRDDIAAFDLAARADVMKLLAQRCAQAPLAEMALLRQGAKQLARTPAARLRRIALLRLIDRTPSPNAWRSRALQEDLPAAMVASDLLARVMAPQAPTTWLDATEQHLTAHVRPSTSQSTKQLAWTDLDPTMQPSWALRRLLRISPMERPRLIAAWTHAQRSAGHSGSTANDDALVMAALALDTPSPLA